MTNLDDKFHQAGAFERTDTNADGHHSGAPGGNYTKWAVGEFRRREKDRKYWAGALADTKEQARRVWGIAQSAMRRTEFLRYAHLTIKVGDNIEVTGEEALTFIQNRLDRLKTVKTGIDAQLSDSADNQIDIDEQSAKYLKRRLNDDVTVYRRPNGTYYVDRDDAAFISMRLTEKIGELEAGQDGIQTCEHDKHDASVHIGKEAGDAIMEGKLEEQIKDSKIDLKQLSPEERSLYEDIHTEIHGDDLLIEEHTQESEVNPTHKAGNLEPT